MEGDDDAADGDVVVGRAMTWVRSCLRRVQVGVCIDWGARGKELSDKDGVARVFMRQSGGLGNYSLACHLTCGSPGVNSHCTGRNIISVIVAHSQHSPYTLRLSTLGTHYPTIPLSPPGAETEPVTPWSPKEPDRRRWGTWKLAGMHDM